MTTPSRAPSRATIRRRRQPLLDWYDVHRRDLPWRRTSDPWAIWVSEIMLQQTQVATVLRYYDRFLERFPDVEALAAASGEEVRAAWTGLGYYRRADSLHRGARQVVDRHGGQVPTGLKHRLELPGVGRYTAGAIGSIAFGREEPILDGNVRRVLSRWFAIDGQQTTPAAEERLLWSIAEKIVEGKSPGDLNQALMELGATVCTPANPSCDACPVTRGCAARRSGDPTRYPTARPRKAPRDGWVAVAWLQRERDVLLERRDRANPLRGSWELPAIELTDLPARTRTAPADTPARVADMLASRHGIRADVHPVAGVVRHGILDRRFRLLICPATTGDDGPTDDDTPETRWSAVDELQDEAVSSATLKARQAVERAVDRLF